MGVKYIVIIYLVISNTYLMYVNPGVRTERTIKLEKKKIPLGQ